MPFEFIDHLVYATSDLAATARDLSERFGLALSPGGSHIGLGTANVLMSLGGTCYLEIIGPDLDQTEPEGPRPFGIDDLTDAAHVTFAVTADAIDERCRQALNAGYDPGRILDMSRKKPGGELLEWRLTVKAWSGPKSLVPFLIDWGKTPRPGLSLPAGCQLTGFELQHPKPQGVQDDLRALGLSLDVSKGPAKIIARIQTPKGEIELC